MATSQGPLFPFNEDMTALQGSLVAPKWRRWLLNLRNAVDTSTLAVKTVTETGQSGSLPTTPMDGGNISAGLYGVRWDLSITTTEAASTAQVTIAWVEDSLARAYIAPVVDGSIAANAQVDQNITIFADGGTPISFSLAYVGATMVYAFRIVLNSVSQG